MALYNRKVKEERIWKFEDPHIYDMSWHKNVTFFGFVTFRWSGVLKNNVDDIKEEKDSSSGQMGFIQNKK